MELARIVEHLDSYLRVNEIRDSSLNGLQVETDRDITLVAVAVDASMEAFVKARDAGAQLLVVHHGLIWDKAAIRGPLYRRVCYLVENRIGLYAAHLPLDMHPEVGNNAQLAKIVRLTNARPFLQYEGSLIGLVGDIEKTTPDELARTVERGIHGPTRLLDCGPREVTRVAICSGAGGSDLDQAVREGAHAYLTGEVSHQAAALAPDGEISLIFAGHYATETLGPRALAEHVNATFGLPTAFIHAPTGL